MNEKANITVRGRRNSRNGSRRRNHRSSEYGTTELKKLPVKPEESGTSLCMHMYREALKGGKKTKIKEIDIVQQF